MSAARRTQRAALLLALAALCAVASAQPPPSGAPNGTAPNGTAPATMVAAAPPPAPNPMGPPAGYSGYPAAAQIANNAAAVQPGKRGPAELSSSIILTGFWDMEGDVGGGVKPCQFAARKAGQFGAKKISIVVTVHGLGAGGNGLAGYAFKDYSGNLLPASPATISRWESGVKFCVQQALAAGFTGIHVIAHVDPIQKDGKGIWRNVQLFDPLATYGPSGQAYSYDDVLLKPTARAINAAMQPSTTVWYTLTGEQGLSVFTYPKRWAQLLDTTKAACGAGKPAGSVKTGVSLNWDKVCGCVEPEERDPIIYNNTYTQRLTRWTNKGGPSKVDLAGTRALLDKSDFLGTSGYGPMNPVPTANEMERAIQTVAYEFALFGWSLKDYMFAKNKPFLYNEQGLGGCKYNLQVAPNVTWISMHPWLGLWPNNGWEKSNDPWQVPAFQDYRRSYHSTLLSWLGAGGGPQYRIDGAYTWSVGTWDPLGVHPQSYGNGGSYIDTNIQSMVTKHNKMVNGGQSGRRRLRQQQHQQARHRSAAAEN